MTVTDITNDLVGLKKIIQQKLAEYFFKEAPAQEDFRKDGFSVLHNEMQLNFDEQLIFPLKPQKHYLLFIDALTGSSNHK